MESIRAKFERNISLDLPNPQQHQIDAEKSKVHSKKRHSLETSDNNANNEVSEQVEAAPSEKIPEIKDIYDYIYGNVQSKLEFYEGKQSIEHSSKSRTSISEDFNDCASNFDNLHESSSESAGSPKILTFDDSVTPAINENSIKFPTTSLPSPVLSETKNTSFNTSDLSSSEGNSSDKSNVNEKTVEILQPNPDLLKDCKVLCNKCQEVDFINDRTEVLSEINTKIKLELENAKQELKGEIEKNSELNYEIANIESALEAYYKEAKTEKSTLASIYSTMKNYASSHKTDFQQSYTFKRIKAIADYMETLKHKLEHQDRIIRNNFVENPYYADIMIKHTAALKQLDEISKETQELKDDIKRKAAEELEIIKELNRQKFQMENKCKEIEKYYKDELVSKEALMRRAEDEYRKQLGDYQDLLKQKDEDMLKMQNKYEIRIGNYKQELVVVYRKWKEQKLVNTSNN